MRVDRRAFAHRRALDHLVRASTQLCELIFTDHALEDVEPVFPVSRYDVRMQPAGGIQPDGSAVPDRASTRFALLEVCGHARSVCGGAGLVRLGVGRQGVHGKLRSRFLTR